MLSKPLRSAFTLVEIMVVVVIIGIIAAIAVPAFNQARTQAQQNSIMENLRVISSAAQQYFITNGSATSVTTDDLTPSFLNQLPVSVAGESYSGMTINATDTSISVTPVGDGAQPIVYNY